MGQSTDLDKRGDALRVLLVARQEQGITGTSRYAANLLPELRALGVEADVAQSSHRPFPAHLLGMDLGTFFSHYPLGLKKQNVDLYHLTSQNLASLLIWQKLDRPVVVTVHDIIPYLVRHDDKLNTYRHPFHRAFDARAMRGLKRADALLADSWWTKDTLVQQLRIAPERIYVVPLGVDNTRFQPLPVPDGFRQRYALPAEKRYLLYVGSEDPRKNLEMLLVAFAQLAQDHPDVQFVKVGAPRHQGERRRLQDIAHHLSIEGSVRWFDAVPEEDLPLFYNVAEVFVLPSRYEGFGLPVLEALACGTAVVCAGGTALPEVAGADSVVCPPTVGGVADALELCMTHGRDSQRQAQRVHWAKQFTWRRTAELVKDVYQTVKASVPHPSLRSRQA